MKGSYLKGLRSVTVNFCSLCGEEIYDTEDRYESTNPTDLRCWHVEYVNAEDVEDDRVYLV